MKHRNHLATLAGCLIAALTAMPWLADARADEARATVERRDIEPEGYAERAEQFRSFLRGDGMIGRLSRPVWSDHTKYLWPVVLAILDEGPEHPHFQEAVKVMNHGAYAGTWVEERWNKRVKYNREFFHFAGQGMARLLIDHREHWEADELAEIFRIAVPHGGLRAFEIGTANHRTMSMTNSYLVMQEAAKAGVNGAAALRNQARQQMIDFAYRLFHHGMPEWDSSTYYAFTMIGFMNVYDLADDPAMRELAGAVLDWLTANYALKYTQGVFGGPESRGGSAHRSVNAITDQLGYLWFGDAPIETEDLGGSAAYVGHILGARFRPDPIVVNLARKTVEMPFTSYGSRPTTPVAERPNFAREIFHVDPRFTLGTIFERRDGWHYAANQQVTWKLAVRGRDGARTLNGAGMTRTHSHTSGRDPWTQVGQHEATLVQMSLLLPDAQVRDDLTNRTGSYLAYPKDAPPVERQGILFFDWDGTFIAARPINGDLKYHEEPANDRLIVEDQATEGQVCGFVIEASSDFDSLEDFQDAILQRTRLDRTALQDERTISYTNLKGRVIRMRYITDDWHYEYFTRTDRVEGPGHGRQAALWVDGRRLDLDSPWPIFASPYLYAARGELRITDGRDGLRITVDRQGNVTRTRWPQSQAVSDDYATRFYR
ncbi:MAG: hypothetical protein JJU36_13770 [Phycisphaeraceae bacterium]|nr:hypothetical protein [Phycisphaeraceae bacterium]